MQNRRYVLHVLRSNSYISQPNFICAVAFVSRWRIALNKTNEKEKSSVLPCLNKALCYVMLCYVLRIVIGSSSSRWQTFKIWVGKGSRGQNLESALRMVFRTVSTDISLNSANEEWQVEVILTTCSHVLKERQPDH